MSTNILWNFTKACLILFCFGMSLDFLKATEKINVVVSIYPFAEFAKEITGEKGDVVLLLPPGVEAHSWKPRPSDITKIIKADLFIYIGAGMEPWVHDILDSIKKPSFFVIEASHGMELLSTAEGKIAQRHGHSYDPHVWLDLENDIKIIDKITESLSKISPKSSLLFQARADAYKRKLTQLDLKFKKELKQCSQKTFIVGGHAAFGYLARRYGLKQVSLYGVNPDSKPTPRKLRQIVDLARKYKAEVIFFEQSISNDLAKIIAREIGARTLSLNPGTTLKPEEMGISLMFIQIMEKNLENLKNGLMCR